MISREEETLLDDKMEAINIIFGKFNNETRMYEIVDDNTQQPLWACICDEHKKKTLSFDCTKGLDEILTKLEERNEQSANRGKNRTIWMLYSNLITTAITERYKRIENKGKLRILNDSPAIYILNANDKRHFSKLLDLKNWAGCEGKERIEIINKIREELGESKIEIPKSVQLVKELKTSCEEIAKTSLKFICQFRDTIEREYGYMIRSWTTLAKLSQDLLRTFNENKFYCKKCGEKDEFDIQKFKLENRILQIGICKKCGTNATTRAGWVWTRGKLPRSKNPELLQKASRGGRFEAFVEREKVIQGDIYHLDITSDYTNVCSNMDFPDLTCEKEFNEENMPEDIIENEEKYPFGNLSCVIRAPKTYIGYLGIRFKGDLIFPTDCTLESTWTFLEIRNAIKEGYVLLDKRKALVYTKKLPFSIFKEFNEIFFNLKNNAKSTFERNIWKRILNLYTGRFGLRKFKDRERKEIPLQELEDYKQKGFYAVKVTDEGNVIINKGRIKEYGGNAHGIIYGMITAYARDILYQHMKKINPEDLLYVACDSIIFKGAENLKHFIIGKGLGEWKIETNGKEFEVLTEDTYRLDEKIKASGIERSHQDWNKMKNEGVITTRFVSTKWSESINQNIKLRGTSITETKTFDRLPKRMRNYDNYISDITESEKMKNLEWIKQERVSILEGRSSV